MQIVITHDLADFDALASAVAAQKLYPGAQIVLAGRVGVEVGGYLSLHKDHFPTVRLADLDLAAVDTVIVVDVRVRSRLKDFEAVFQRRDRGAGVAVIIFDHHPATDDDLIGDEEVVEPVGSATTLMVERMRDGGVPVDSVEATLFALGIHADTGSLTFAVSTARDARALAWLMECGVQMPVLRRYLRQPFSADQSDLLQSALAAISRLSVGHLPVAFAAVETERAVDGQAEVVSTLLSLTGAAAVLLAVGHSKERVHIVARSKTPLIDVASCLKQFGGGGHAAAASAALKERRADEVIQLAQQWLQENPPQPTRVAEVMSSPVHAVDVHTPLTEVAASLTAWVHVGAPVVREGKLVGMLSRRDLSRARADGRLDRPAASCMSHNLVTIGPEASLDEALALMQKRDVGRLPVLAAGRLVGIVTRSDLLAVLYGRRGKPAPSADS